VRDQIDFDFLGNGYFNIDRTRARGVEVEIDWRLAETLRGSIAYTLTDAVDLGTGDELLRVPRHKGTAVIDWTPASPLTLSASVIVNGREADFPAPNAAFVRLDLRAAWALSERFELYGRVENATDTDYQDVSGYGEPGASAVGGLRVRL
jgi:vitamin B12 transporter